MWSRCPDSRRGQIAFRGGLGGRDIYPSSCCRSLQERNQATFRESQLHRDFTPTVGHSTFYKRVEHIVNLFIT